MILTKYYVMQKDAAGQRTVINEKTGTPQSMKGVTVIEDVTAED